MVYSSFFKWFIGTAPCNAISRLFILNQLFQVNGQIGRLFLGVPEPLQCGEILTVHPGPVFGKADVGAVLNLFADGLFDFGHKIKYLSALNRAGIPRRPLWFLHKSA